eukprot:Rmarinus@m.16704
MSSTDPGVLADRELILWVNTLSGPSCPLVMNLEELAHNPKVFVEVLCSALSAEYLSSMGCEEQLVRLWGIASRTEISSMAALQALESILRIVGLQEGSPECRKSNPEITDKIVLCKIIQGDVSVVRRVLHLVQSVSTHSTQMHLVKASRTQAPLVSDASSVDKHPYQVTRDRNDRLQPESVKVLNKPSTGRMAAPLPKPTDRGPTRSWHGTMAEVDQGYGIGEPPPYSLQSTHSPLRVERSQHPSSHAVHSASYPVYPRPSREREHTQLTHTHNTIRTGARCSVHHKDRDCCFQDRSPNGVDGTVSGCNITGAISHTPDRTGGFELGKSCDSLPMGNCKSTLEWAHRSSRDYRPESPPMLPPSRDSLAGSDTESRVGYQMDADDAVLGGGEAIRESGPSMATSTCVDHSAGNAAGADRTAKTDAKPTHPTSHSLQPSVHSGPVPPPMNVNPAAQTRSPTTTNISFVRPSKNKLSHHDAANLNRSGMLAGGPWTLHSKQMAFGYGAGVFVGDSDHNLALPSTTDVKAMLAKGLAVSNEDIATHDRVSSPAPSPLPAPPKPIPLRKEWAVPSMKLPTHLSPRKSPGNRSTRNINLAASFPPAASISSPNAKEISSRSEQRPFHATLSASTGAMPVDDARAVSFHALRTNLSATRPDHSSKQVHWAPITTTQSPPKRENSSKKREKIDTVSGADTPWNSSTKIEDMSTAVASIRDSYTQHHNSTSQYAGDTCNSCSQSESSKHAVQAVLKIGTLVDPTHRPKRQAVRIRERSSASCERCERKKHSSESRPLAKALFLPLDPVHVPSSKEHIRHPPQSREDRMVAVPRSCVSDSAQVGDLDGVKETVYTWLIRVGVEQLPSAPAAGLAPSSHAVCLAFRTGHLLAELVDKLWPLALRKRWFGESTSAPERPVPGDTGGTSKSSAVDAIRYALEVSGHVYNRVCEGECASPATHRHVDPRPAATRPNPTLAQNQKVDDPADADLDCPHHRYDVGRGGFDGRSESLRTHHADRPSQRTSDSDRNGQVNPCAPRAPRATPHRLSPVFDGSALERFCRGEEDYVWAVLAALREITLFQPIGEAVVHPTTGRNPYEDPGAQEDCGSRPQGVEAGGGELRGVEGCVPRLSAGVLGVSVADEERLRRWLYAVGVDLNSPEGGLFDDPLRNGTLAASLAERILGLKVPTLKKPRDLASARKNLECVLRALVSVGFLEDGCPLTNPTSYLKGQRSAIWGIVSKFRDASERTSSSNPQPTTITYAHNDFETNVTPRIGSSLVEDGSRTAGHRPELSSTHMEGYPLQNASHEGSSSSSGPSFVSVAADEPSISGETMAIASRMPPVSEETSHSVPDSGSNGVGEQSRHMNKSEQRGQLGRGNGCEDQGPEGAAVAQSFIPITKNDWMLWLSSEAHVCSPDEAFESMIGRLQRGTLLCELAIEGTLLSKPTPSSRKLMENVRRHVRYDVRSPSSATANLRHAHTILATWPAFSCPQWSEIESGVVSGDVNICLKLLSRVYFAYTDLQRCQILNINPVVEDVDPIYPNEYSDHAIGEPEAPISVSAFASESGSVPYTSVQHTFGEEETLERNRFLPEPNVSRLDDAKPVSSEVTKKQAYIQNPSGATDGCGQAAVDDRLSESDDGSEVEAFLAVNARGPSVATAVETTLRHRKAGARVSGWSAPPTACGYSDADPSNSANASSEGNLKPHGRTRNVWSESDEAEVDTRPLSWNHVVGSGKDTLISGSSQQTTHGGRGEVITKRKLQYADKDGSRGSTCVVESDGKELGHVSNDRTGQVRTDPCGWRGKHNNLSQPNDNPQYSDNLSQPSDNDGGTAWKSDEECEPGRCGQPTDTDTRVVEIGFGEGSGGTRDCSANGSVTSRRRSHRRGCPVPLSQRTPMKEPGEDDPRTWDRRDILLQRWMKALGIRLSERVTWRAEHLSSYCDGVILCQMLERLERKKLTGVTNPAKARASRLHNVRKVMDVLRTKKGLCGEYLCEEDAIVDGNAKYTCGLLWQMRRAYRHVLTVVPSTGHQVANHNRS